MDKPYYFHGKLIGTISEDGRITLTRSPRINPYRPPRVELIPKTARSTPTPS